jgi:protein SCO1/2
MKRHAAWFLFIAMAAAHAQFPAAPPAQVDFIQNLNARLPLQSIFTSDNGSKVRLADFFQNNPVVLVLGYYHCPNLCSTLMDGVLQTLAAVNLPHNAYRFVAVSIDPTENAQLAARKKYAYMPMLGRHGGDIHLLTGDKADIARLANTVGFQYQYDASLRQYIHPAGFVIATPDGHISHYFMGVRFEPKDVRLALVEASSGRIGSPVDRLLLLCCDYDPQTGRYSVAVMTVVRIVCIGIFILVASWIWLHRRSQARSGGSDE